MSRIRTTSLSPAGAEHLLRVPLERLHKHPFNPNRIDGGLVDANTALKAIFDGAKLERIARGQPGERQEIEGEVETRLSLLEDPAFEALLRIVEGGLEGGGEEEAR
jgi:hypothetical protein